MPIRCDSVGAVALARTRDRSGHTLGMISVGVTTIAWGLVPLALKQTHMPTMAFASYRLWFGVCVYVAALLVTGRRIHWSTIRTCALGGVFFAADVTLSFSAFKLTSVASATIIGALAPIAIALGAARWFGERFERRDAVFIAASFVGVAVVAVGSAGSPSWSPLGDAFAAVGVLSWTSYWLFSKRARRTVPTLEYMATVMLLAAVVVSSITAVSGISLAPPTGMDWLWVWLLVLIPGAMGHMLLAWSHGHVEAWIASLITQGQPVVGSIAAWLLLGEALTILTVVGGIVVLGATAVIAVREARRQQEGVEPLAQDAAGG
jgi:drug/metabolite transporter (DMT)-like permease